MKRVSRWAALAVLSIAGAWSLLGSPVGSIQGAVKDSTGALVPGVKVTLTNTSTNARLDTTTDPNGEFQFLQLPPATYSLTAEAQGFKKVDVSSVLVQVDQITHLDLTLEVGSLSESVQVEAVAPLLENDKSTLSSVVNSRTISDMPLNARQVLDLALVTPGVVPTGAGTQGLGFNVSGARAQSNVFMWDGVSNMDTQINSALNNFRIDDAVQEFSVQTSVASAEFGRGTGGEVDVVTKSGSNEFHGTLFEYLRNSDLDAADFFTNLTGAPKTPLHRNQYGATLGGPIKRDKIFFFASYEGFRQVAPTVSTTRVPTAAERAQVTDPISKALLQFWPTPNATIPGSANNFIANVGSTDFDSTGLIRIDYRIGDKDTLSARFADYQGTVFTAGALPLLDGNANVPVSRNGSLVWDHTFSPTLLNEFRVGYSRNQTFFTVQDNGFNAASIFQTNGQPLPGVVNAAQNPQDSGLPTIVVSGGYAQLGTSNNLPQGRITNTTELFDNYSWTAPFGKSKHNFRMGYHIREEQARRYLDGSSRGTFNFVNWSDFAAGLANTSTFRSGSTLAYWNRFPWDLYWQDQYKMKDNLTLNYGLRYEYPSAIYQNRFDATNFVPGVGPVLLGTNKLLTINPSGLGPAAFGYAQAPFTLTDSGVHVDKNNFAPVLGLAYTPRFAEKIFGHDDTVIRAGFRVGYDDIFNNIPANMGLNAPYSLTTTQAAGVTQPGKFPWITGFNQGVPLVKFNPDGTPKVGLVSFNAEDPNIRSSYLYQYNMGVQRKIGNNFSIEMDYQGSTGHKLGMFVDQNQPLVIVNNPLVRGNQSPNLQIFPYPLFGTISTGEDIGNSNYNGGVAIAKYQARAYFLQASYVYSKSIDDVSAFFGSSGERGAPASSRNINLERGPSSFDTRQHASILYSMDLPAGPGHRVLGWNNAFNRQLFGGWTVSGLVTAQTGQPFTVYNTAQDFSGFNQFNDRPDVIATGPLPQNNNNRSDAFGTPGAGPGRGYFSATPPTGRVGTSGRNQFYGPGLFNWDLAAAKNFTITENRIRLQFRGDFFNLFNNTNFANPIHDESSALFGQITQTLGSAVATAVGTTAGAYGAPRQIQFSLRLLF
jgi:hypothetical protein